MLPVVDDDVGTQTFAQTDVRRARIIATIAPDASQLDGQPPHATRAALDEDFLAVFQFCPFERPATRSARPRDGRGLLHARGPAAWGDGGFLDRDGFGQCPDPVLGGRA